VDVPELWFRSGCNGKRNEIVEGSVQQTREAVTMHVTQTPPSVREDSFEITDGKSRLTFFIRNMDFPGQHNKKTRGEIYYIEVAKESRKKGLGLAMCRKALSLMKAVGTKTVNMSAVTDEGRALIISLIHHGDITGPIKRSSTGKMEFQIT
jgi:predicted acetyltransferase